MTKSSLFSLSGVLTLCLFSGSSQHAWSAPVTSASKKTVATKKVALQKPKKTQIVTPPPPQQTFDTIEDEDLVMIPENEVFATVIRPSTIETSAIAHQEPAKPTEPKSTGISQEEASTVATVAEKTSDTTTSSASASLQPDASIAPAVTVTPQSYEYYRVGNKDINTLTYRLRIVQAILEESGKAYDYRSLKTRDLVKILNRTRMERRAREMNAVLESPQLAE